MGDALTGGTWVTVKGIRRWVPTPPPPKSRGNVPKPLTLAPEDIRRGYSQYRQGSRTTFAVEANRQYQRMWRRRKRGRLKTAV